MAKQDYYETLGVSRSASDADLKDAYRKLAMKCHPDRNPNDAAAEHRFKDISEAYDVLKDRQKRAAYDRFRHPAFENGGGRGPSPGAPPRCACRPASPAMFAPAPAPPRARSRPPAAPARAAAEYARSRDSSPSSAPVPPVTASAG